MDRKGLVGNDHTAVEPVVKLVNKATWLIYSVRQCLSISRFPIEQTLCDCYTNFLHSHVYIDKIF